jgi:hypothetical protein
MPSPRQNAQTLADTLAKVKAHCMCLTFHDDGGRYRVMFAPGYEVGGVQVSHGMGKIKAAAILLEKCEYYWASSFPNYQPAKP